MCLSTLLCLGCTMEAPSQDSHVVAQTLTKLLKDPHPDVRRTAALSLGKIGDSNSIPALATALKDDDAKVREFSAWALGQSGTMVSDDAALALVTALGDEVSEVKHAAASSLEQVAPRAEILKLLREIMAISEAETRIAVVQALSEFDTPLAYPLFVQALKDPEAQVRQTAVAGLGELTDRRAMPLFRHHLLQDKDEGVRTEAAFRIGKLGDNKDIPTLQKAIETDPTPNVHLWATWALQEIASTPVN